MRVIRLMFLIGACMLLGAAPSCSETSAQDYPRVSVGGFVGVQYFDDASTNAGSPVDGWKFKCARLHARSSLSERLGGIIQYEACSGTPVITVAYISLMHIPHTLINIGHVKLSFGMDIYRHPLTNPTVNPSYASTKIWPGSDMGVQVTHTRRYVFTTVSFQNGNPFAFSDNNNAKSFCGKLVLRPSGGLDVGGSYYVGKLGADERSTTRYAGQMEYRNNGLWLRGEWLASNDEQTAGGSKIKSLGYYGVAAYRVLPQVEAYSSYGSTR